MRRRPKAPTGNDSSSWRWLGISSPAIVATTSGETDFYLDGLPGPGVVTSHEKAPCSGGQARGPSKPTGAGGSAPLYFIADNTPVAIPFRVAAGGCFARLKLAKEHLFPADVGPT